MPLTAEQRARYPKDWRSIRGRVMERAGNRCECTGECGDEHAPWGGITGPSGIRESGYRICRAPHSRFILRDEHSPAVWEEHNPGEDCDWECETGCRAIRCVLTVAHLDQTPENNDMDNLKALCQRCHLRLDRYQHHRNAAATRVRKRSNLDLFTEAP